MFYICKEKCFCASQAGEGYTKGTLLYCFGEVRTTSLLLLVHFYIFQVVIPKTELREEDSETPQILEDLESYYLQIAQLAVILFMIISV